MVRDVYLNSGARQSSQEAKGPIRAGCLQDVAMPKIFSSLIDHYSRAPGLSERAACNFRRGRLVSELGEVPTAETALLAAC